MLVQAHIILLGQAKKFPNLRCSLRPQSLGQNLVCHARYFFVSLLHNTEGQNTQVHSHDAASDTFPPSLTGPSGSIARVTVTEQQSDTGRMHDPLFHGEALLVVASSDAEDVTFEFGSNGVSGNFLAHAAVHEDAELALIVDFDELLRPV